MITIKKKRGVIKNAECVFVPYRYYGLKLYKTKAIAERVRDRQILAHSKGIGPEVLGDVIEYKICPPNCRKIRVMYGYRTQLVFVMENVSKEIVKVEKQMARLFRSEFLDFHDGNYGVLNGKVVAIDFGDMTFN